jgi:NADP-dependent 3-hydroxy acid dehydrogenase YdfG
MSFTAAAASSPRSAWAVVTGASSGLGREFALALDERGYPDRAGDMRSERAIGAGDEMGDGAMEAYDISCAVADDELLHP